MPTSRVGLGGWSCKGLQAFVTSILSLAHLAEFAYLARRYDASIDWPAWYKAGAAWGMGRQLRIYLALAHRLMGMPCQDNIPGVALAGMHVARITGAANNRAAYLSGRESPPRSAVERIRAVAVRSYVAAFKHLNRPVWIWRNLCYRRGVVHLPPRLFWWLVFLWQAVNFRKAFSFKTMQRKLYKIKTLLKKPEGT